MGRAKSQKNSAEEVRGGRTSIWDAVTAVALAGWSQTLRLCVVLLVLIAAVLIAAALLNARWLSAFPGSSLADAVPSAFADSAITKIRGHVSVNGNALSAPAKTKNPLRPR